MRWILVGVQLIVGLLRLSEYEAAASNGAPLAAGSRIAIQERLDILAVLWPKMTSKNQGILIIYQTLSGVLIESRGSS